MTIDRKISKRDLEKLRLLASEKRSITTMLRKVFDTYGIEPHRAAWIATDIYESRIRGEDIQLLWKWKVGLRDDGLTDDEIDTYLSHLYKD